MQLRLKIFTCVRLQVLLVYGLAFMVILPVVVVSLSPLSIYSPINHTPAYLRSYYMLSLPSLKFFFISIFFPSFPVALKGTWWYRSIRYSGDQILINTTQLFMHFMCKTPNMNMKRELILSNPAFSLETEVVGISLCFQLLNSRMSKPLQSLDSSYTFNQTTNLLLNKDTPPPPPRSRFNHGSHGGLRVRPPEQ